MSTAPPVVPGLRLPPVAQTALMGGLPILLGLSLALPHLVDALWYDEAYTLEFFATGNPVVAFVDYREPNNHVLFSAV